MCPASPWNEGAGREISWEMPLAHHPAGLHWERKAGGREIPTFLTQSKVRDLEETLGIQQKIIQLKVPASERDR